MIHLIETCTISHDIFWIKLKPYEIISKLGRGLDSLNFK